MFQHGPTTTSSRYEEPNIGNCPCSKQWDLGYDKLLSNLSAPKLQSHRLCKMFKILHNLISFPSSVFVPRPSRCWSNVIFQPFAHTNCFCTHLYLVPFLLGIRCQLTLLMHLLYLHLKHCIHALKTESTMGDKTLPALTIISN